VTRDGRESLERPIDQHKARDQGYGNLLPQNLQRDRMWLLDRIVRWVALVAHGSMTMVGTT